MEEKLLNEAINFSENIIRLYYSHRDNYAVISKMAENTAWIGPGLKEKIYSLDAMKKHLDLGKEEVPSCDVSDFDLRAISLGENYCVVVGSMTIRTKPESGMVVEVDQRASFVLHYIDNHFEIVHLHNSNPYGEMEEGEYFPHKIGSKSYEYLQRLLNEKIEVLDMITSNLNGGLKGSNDDSTYSYFYVNEGLPQMLGYTYDEFMKKSGGSAVGAVYPPDLNNALADCERCFKTGDLYSSEYRMEKKDGSLIWVLDSGRKVKDNDGITRINSIITDITPLKQALFDLEIERERYRIALENITGAMCEYDIESDSLILYHHVDTGEGNVLKKSMIEKLTEIVYSSKKISKENAELFLSVCKGETTEVVEFQAQLSENDDTLYWIQFSCSVISEHPGKPLRTIGVLKDITKEKNRNLELLKKAQCDGLTGLYNHTTAKEAIRTYLSKECKESPYKCALIMLDLDHFKKINDLNGHAYGDDILFHTANILNDAAGRDSIVGRIGGDEFLILIKDKEPSDVKNIAEVILNQIEKNSTEKGFPVTCSLGIAYHYQCDETFTELFARVDKALYNAKDKGRNRLFMDCPITYANQ